MCAAKFHHRAFVNRAFVQPECIYRRIEDAGALPDALLTQLTESASRGLAAQLFQESVETYKQVREVIILIGDYDLLLKNLSR
jgi:hypothetical protein